MKNNDIINTFFAELQNAKNNVLYCLEHPNGSVNFLGLEHWAGCVARLQKQINDIMFPELPLMLPAPIKKSTRNEKLPAVKERRPKIKHTCLCRSMLSKMSSTDRADLRRHGINLASSSLTVSPKRCNQSTSRILKESRKEGRAQVLVAIYQYNDWRGVGYRCEAAYPEGENWTSSTTKKTFDEIRRYETTKLYLVSSEPLEYVDDWKRREEYDPFKREDLKKYEWKRRQCDKSGYQLKDIEAEKRRAHCYFEDLRRKQAEAAFNTDDREKALTEAKSTLTATRMKIAEYIIENDYVPTVDFWSIGLALRHIENAKTDNELKEGIDEFNKALTKINNLLTPKAA